MKKIILLVFILQSAFTILHSQSVRPVRDDVGFCWNAEEMNSFMSWLDKNSGKTKSNHENLIGGISVHDDYLYAGKVYYPLFKMINAKEVVIFGVTHGTVKKELGNLKDVLILDNYDEWIGPYGNIGISPLREKIKKELPAEYFIVNDKAHAIEHSIEAEVPFLQYYNRGIKITPIMITQIGFERMDSISEKLSSIFYDYAKSNNLKPGKDIFFLISNDADHYGEDFNNSPYGMDLKAHQTATDNDRRILAENLEGKIDHKKIFGITGELWPDASNQKIVPLWCGRYPIVIGLLTIEKTMNKITSKNIFGRLLKYSDTITEKVLPIKNTSMGLTAVFSPKHWCGWFTLGIYTY
jgi:AmmeMemoRadiSam system protein B